MNLSGLHLLLTYGCTSECDHCFVWGSPTQSGTMTLALVRNLLRQARELGTVESIYFEGGEPFLYYATLRRGVEEAHDMGFEVGVVTNAYWATSLEDAEEWLRPFAGKVRDLSLSDDTYHGSAAHSARVNRARQAAMRLEIPIGTISVAQPEAACRTGVGQLPAGESDVMYRGRAAETLAKRAAGSPWMGFDRCPHEDLREPGRLHVDPFGNLHLCQGLCIGNALDTSLAQVCASYDPATHPIAGPLLAGGPAEMVRHYGVTVAEQYADACHLCYEARRQLRGRFPETLKPDQMYGITAEGAAVV